MYRVSFAVVWEALGTKKWFVSYDAVLKFALQ